MGNHQNYSYNEGNTNNSWSFHEPVQAQLTEDHKYNPYGNSHSIQGRDGRQSSESHYTEDHKRHESNQRINDLASTIASAVAGAFRDFVRLSGGLRTSKLDDENFKNCMSSDIIGLSETHASSKDILALDGYKCHVNCRSDSNKSRGGLAVFIRKEILTEIKLIDNSVNDIMWLKLDENYFGLTRDLFVCFLYISPANSSYTVRTNCDKQLFDKLYNDVAKYGTSWEIMLLGDLNAHVKCDELDFITNEVDDTLDDFLPVNYEADCIHKLRNTEIPQSTNNYGKSVIEICTESQLRILNG
ncbi:unnamed protein product [Mytilus edulis]|uniref:Endonuclease/exonuclease/phosphatase domain-containing protein n=1 Tax=Mytilus edulis TaxID=6550 RepID=A0A8S3V790_MYTED|nr:unnamed protein product [Mytilus edulis]